MQHLGSAGDRQAGRSFYSGWWSRGLCSLRLGRLGCDAANAKAPTNHFQPLSPVLVLAPPIHHFQPLSPVLVLTALPQSLPAPLTCPCPGLQPTGSLSCLGCRPVSGTPLKPAEHACTGALPAWLMQAWSVLTASCFVNACFPSICLVASFYFPDCLGLPVFCHRRTTHPYFPVTRTVSFVQLGANKYK